MGGTFPLTLLALFPQVSSAPVIGGTVPSPDTSAQGDNWMARQVESAKQTVANTQWLRSSVREGAPVASQEEREYRMPEAIRLRNARLALAAAQSEFEAAVAAYALAEVNRTLTSSA